MPVLVNSKHERFAQALASGETADAAYAIAGYKANRGNASTLKANQIILDRVAEILGNAAAQVELDEAYVLGTIRETVERCRQSDPVLDRKGEQVFTETPDGESAAAYIFDAKNVLRGAELIGKHLGMFKEKVEHSGKVEVETSADPLDLARRIAFLLKKGAKEAE